MIVTSGEWQKYHFIRGSIIPYVVVEGVIFYALGIDSDAYNICDFGGGRDSTDPDIVETSLRELREESYNVFLLTRNKVMQSNWIMHQGSFLIFTQVYGDMKHYSLLFNERVKQDKERGNKPEMLELIWLSRKQLITLIKQVEGENMYELLRRMLHSNIGSL